MLSIGKQGCALRISILDSRCPFSKLSLSAASTFLQFKRRRSSLGYPLRTWRSSWLPVLRRGPLVLCLWRSSRPGPLRCVISVRPPSDVSTTLSPFGRGVLLARMVACLPIVPCVGSDTVSNLPDIKRLTRRWKASALKSCHLPSHDEIPVTCRHVLAKGLHLEHSWFVGLGCLQSETT